MKKRDYIKTVQDSTNQRIWDFIVIRYQSIARKNVFWGILWIIAACVVFGCIAVIGWVSSFSLLFRDLHFTPHYLRTTIVSLRLSGEQATAFLDASLRDYKVRLSYGSFSVKEQMKDFQNANMSHQAATSTKDWFELCMSTLKNDVAVEKKKNINARFPVFFGYEDFKRLYGQSAQIILARRRENSDFVIDEHNEAVITQIFLYVTMNEEFSGDLQKGIMLVGKYGSGKTLIMQAMAELHNTIVHTLQISRPLLKFLKSSDLLENLKDKPIKNYARLPLVIDEFQSRLWNMATSKAR